MNKHLAEELTQAVGQSTSGAWRTIAGLKRLGVPKALGLTEDEWLKKYLGNYIQLAVGERYDAILAAKEAGLSNRAIAGAAGVNESTIRDDLKKRGVKPAPKKPQTRKPQGNGSSPAGKSPLTELAAVAITEEQHAAIAKDQAKAEAVAQRRAQRAADALAAAAATKDAGDFNVRHGSFVDVAAELADGSLRLIFTDPPYHDNTIGLYRDLGRVAARVLRDGGSLITYTSHHRLPDVIAMIQSAGLAFFWPLAMVHTGQKARMTEYGIVVHWKPLLWFVKGTFRDRAEMTFLDDLVMSERQKTDHDWQQSTVEAEYYIQQLTLPGDLVFDPFCGGGTTAVAAHYTGRRWLTCDVDHDSVLLGRRRLMEAIRADQ
jgi:hypothetical protein